MNLLDAIENSLTEAHDGAKVYKDPTVMSFIEIFSGWLAEAFDKGFKLLICGNGGSLCDAMHIAEEFTGQFRKPRKALPALALADPSHITCVGNDLGFNKVFSRGVEAFGSCGDIILLLSTSGNSPNICQALATAKERGLKVVSLLGKDGGAMKGLSDLELIIQGFKTSDRIQEIHMTIMHIVIEMVEHLLFYELNMKNQAALCH